MGSVGQGFEELDAEDALARDVGRVSDPHRLTAINAARSQEQVGAFERLRLILRISVGPDARLEHDLAARLCVPDSQRGIGEKPARRIDELRLADHVERGIVVRLRFEPDVRNHLPFGVAARGVPDTRAAEDQTRAEATCALMTFHDSPP